MSRSRNTARVLRDMAKQEKANAPENAREAREDRTARRSTQDSDSAESQSRVPSTSEETDSVTDKTSGGSSGEDQKEVVAETSTKAAAIVKPAPKPVRKFAMCPKCHEKRYKPEQVGKTVTCINCRASIVLT